MEEKPDLDLDLWLDQEIVLRQNKLKAKFWKILGEVGNRIDPELLLKIHPASRGTKLSKGNDLLGYPYQVLDLVRDFNPTDGLNIRVLNWFGHGIYLFVLIGKNHPKAPIQQLNKHQWVFDQASTPWDYPDILLDNSFTDSPSTQAFEDAKYFQWHKSIHISGDITAVETKIRDELKILTFLLS